MMVYVVESGCYDEMYIAGVYATPEAAMAAHPIPDDHRYPENPSASDTSIPGGWTLTESKDGARRWENQLDWDASREIREYEVEGVPMTPQDFESEGRG